MTDEVTKGDPTPTGELTPDKTPVTPPPADPTPPPKYEPPENIKAQVGYLKRKGEAAVAELLAAMEDEGLIQTGPPPGSDPGDADRITKLERELAKRDAALTYGLTSEDVRILDGTPAEIMAKAEYLSKRIAKPATPGNGETPPPPAPPADPPPPAPAEKVTAPPFVPFPANPADQKEAERQAQARLNELIAKGETFGPTRGG